MCNRVSTVRTCVSISHPCVYECGCNCLCGCVHHVQGTRAGQPGAQVQNLRRHSLSGPALPLHEPESEHFLKFCPPMPSCLALVPTLVGCVSECVCVWLCVFVCMGVCVLCICAHLCVRVYRCLSLGFSTPCEQVWEAPIPGSLGQCSLRTGRSQHSLHLSLPSLYPSTL